MPITPENYLLMKNVTCFNPWEASLWVGTEKTASSSSSNRDFVSGRICSPSARILLSQYCDNFTLNAPNHPIMFQAAYRPNFAGGLSATSKDVQVT